MQNAFYLFLLLLGLTPLSLNAQLDQLFSTNYDAGVRYNPVAQTNFVILDEGQFAYFDFSYKNQWFAAGLKSHPYGAGITYQDLLGKKTPRYSVGASLHFQKAGAIEQVQGNIRFGIQLIKPKQNARFQKNHHQLYLGLGLGIRYFNILFSEIDERTTGDIVLNNLAQASRRNFNPSLGLFGILPTGKDRASKFVYGLAYNNLVQLGYTGNELKSIQHVYLNTSYFINFAKSKKRDKYYLELAFLANLANLSSARSKEKQVDFYNSIDYQGFARFHFNFDNPDQHLTLGVGYAKKSLQVEFNLMPSETIGFGFSWDTQTLDKTRDHLKSWNTAELRVHWRVPQYRPD